MRILYLPNQYSQQRQTEKRRWIYPVLMAMEAQYHRNLGHEVIWDEPWKDYDYLITKPEGISFNLLPAPDRIFTNALDKKYQNNGNFKYLPGTYIQVANGCWHGKCSFCIERNNTWQVREVDDVIDELKECQLLGFKEVFDDSGTFPVGRWLEDYISAIGSNDFNFRLGCNMRMVEAPYSDMRRVGFRMLLFGLESANQNTLDRINKGVKVEDYKYIIKAAKAGLEPHIAVMFGYPWETEKDARETLKLVHYLLRKGYAKTAQASFYNPPDNVSNRVHRKYVRRIYRVAIYPEFWLNKIKDLKDFESFRYLLRQVSDGFRIFNSQDENCSSGE